MLQWTANGLYEAIRLLQHLNKISTIDIRTITGAVDALKVIDRALDRIHMERAKFGAIMSRMNVVIDNLTNVHRVKELQNQELLMLILL